MDSRYNSFDNMERLFDQMRRSMFSGRSGDGGQGFGDGIRVERIDGGLVVVADMPGFEKDEIGVRLHEDRLVLTAEHEAGDELATRRRSLRETISLGEHVDPEDVSASYRNGVLEVRLAIEDDADEGTDIDISE